MPLSSGLIIISCSHLKESLVALIVTSVAIVASAPQFPFPGGINPGIRPAGGDIFWFYLQTTIDKAVWSTCGKQESNLVGA